MCGLLSQPRSGGDRPASCLFYKKGARPPEAFLADYLGHESRDGFPLAIHARQT
jgi:hypothetical protein